MSEETTNYGIPNTTLDTEQYPPQTGDLLGGYIARLSARVRELETLLQERYNGHDALRDTVIRIANHVGYDLHPQRETSEPTAEQYTETRDDQSHVTGLEPTANPYSGDCVCGHRHDDYGCVVVDCPCESTEVIVPEPSTEVCATCGHAEADHIEPAGIHICLGGTLGKPCMCVEYKPVATEENDA